MLEQCLEIKARGCSTHVFLVLISVFTGYSIEVPFVYKFQQRKKYVDLLWKLLHLEYNLSVRNEVKKTHGTGRKCKSLKADKRRYTELF